MKFQVASAVLLCLAATSSAFVKRDAGHVAWRKGVEYVYEYNTAILAGSNDYESFGSVFNVSATVKVQGGDTLSVKFDNVKFGIYNGPYKFYPSPDFKLKEFAEIKPLTEPFQVNLDNGKVRGIVLNDKIENWAQNIQRGLATALQLDLSKIDDKEHAAFTVPEKTIVGDCPTNYQVIPYDDDSHIVEVRKYRSHSECTDSPSVVRKPGIAVLSCKDKSTRDVFNSTGFSAYTLEMKDNNWNVKRINVYSSIIVGIFGTKGMTQYSFQNTHLELVKTNEGSFDKLGAPANSKSYDNVIFEFEKESADEDLTKPSPFFFHYKDIETDHENQMKTQELLYGAITKLSESMKTVGVFKDTAEFHRASPYGVIPLISGLDYEHLKGCWNKYSTEKDSKKTEYQLFLDSLAISGTGPTSLLIRDIVKGTDETAIIMRLMGPFANYVRNPTEKLVKEFETILKKDKPDSIKAKVNGRVIDLAFGSLLNRACKNEGCKNSGLLDKYVNYYHDRYDNAESFEEKTAAVNVLRNIGWTKALEELVDIAADEAEEDSVRVIALGGLKPLGKINPVLLREKIVPIFFNRSESSEVRSVAGIIYMISTKDQSTINEMVIYMWTEKDPNVKNFLRSFLEGMAHSTRPCIKEKGSFANSALRMFPPGEVKTVYSHNLISDYQDPDYHFGQMNHITVHKSGDSVLPNSIYFGLNGAIAGYGLNYLGIFIRAEGFGKLIINKLMDMATGNINSDDIKDVFEKIGVQEREQTPLRLEFALILQNRVITYHAIDGEALKNIPALISKLQEMRSQAESQLEVSRMLMPGAVLYQVPLEFGTPVSYIGSVVAIAGVNFKSSGGKSGTAITKDSNLLLQLNFFGVSTLSNHFPPLRTMHSMIAHRTMRVRVPRHMSIGVDIKQQSLNFARTIPTEEDPLVAMTHATALTAIHGDSAVRAKDISFVNILKDSCPTCEPKAIISKGEGHRETRRLGFLYKYIDLEGIKAGAKYFDCEREHSRVHVFKQLKKFWGPENKNFGKRPVARFLLGMQATRDFLFLSPTTQTCGMKLFYLQDKTSPSVLEKIEGQVRMKYNAEQGKKLGSKILIKSSINLKYGGSVPKTKTLDINAAFQSFGNEKRDLKIKAICKDEKTGKSGIACIDVHAEAKKPNDYFSYEGDNEPTYERRINIVWDKVTQDGKEIACPNQATSPGIKILRKARRSQKQIEDAQSDMWPYKQCRAQKSSPKYPGSLTPATHECVWAAYKQTGLRESNITLDYKVDLAARKRWKIPLAIATTVLMPYWTESSETHEEHTSSDGKFAEGQFKVDVNADREHPTMDIHWHGSEGQDEHFQGVDTSFLPGPLKGRVIHSRFSPLYYQAFMAGLYSYCDVTPGAVQTFDNLTYFGDISECPTLVSADCTKKPRYAVLANKIASDKIAIKAFLGEHKIELDNLNKAKVDGKDVELNDEVWTPDDEDKLFKLVKVDSNNVFVLSYKLGVFIRYTGHYTTVTLGSRYRSTQCGLCGNFDGCPRNELTGPDNKCTKLGPNDMMKAYVVRDGSCSNVGNPTC